MRPSARPSARSFGSARWTAAVEHERDDDDERDPRNEQRHDQPGRDDRNDERGVVGGRREEIREGAYARRSDRSRIVAPRCIGRESTGGRLTEPVSSVANADRRGCVQVVVTTAESTEGRP
jgi:hypothetical protein